MRKSMSKKLLALTMGITMLSTCVVANAEITSQGGESAGLETDTSVSNPVYSLTVPTTASVAIDPMQMTKSGESIVSGDFAIINGSEVPVVVTCTAYLSTVASEVTVVNKADVPDGSDIADTSKKAYIGLAVPKDITATDDDTDGVMDKVEGTYTDKVDVQIPATAKTKDDGTQIQFILNKATFDTSQTPHKIQSSDKTACAAFKLSGLVNPNAAWTASDIKVTTVYKMQGVTGAYYTTNNASDKKEENGYNLLKLTPALKGFVDSSGAAIDTLTVDTSSALIASKLNVDSIDTLEVYNEKYSSWHKIESADYTYSSGTLTIKKDDATEGGIAAYVYAHPSECTKLRVTDGPNTYEVDLSLS